MLCTNIEKRPKSAFPFPGSQELCLNRRQVNRLNDILTSGVPTGKNSLKKSASLVEKVWHSGLRRFRVAPSQQG